MSDGSYMLKEEKFFKDNVLGYIQVKDELIWNLIQCKEFQRLRRIHQLGGMYVTFHTAEHSRFAHSLGVYEIARRMIEEIEGINFSKEEKLLTLCAALLHDLGHGPFSHAFEGVFNFNHEDYTKRILLEDTEVNTLLKEYDETFPGKIASIIDKQYPNNVVIQIISSQFDADRLDYLMRDSFNTGVHYGKTDLQRLFRVMRVVDDRLVIKKSGLREIENYIISRYHMYLQVYYHPTTRSFEIILTKMLDRYRELGLSGYQFISNYDFLQPLLFDEMTIEEYVLLDEPTVIHYAKLFMLEKDELLKEFASRLMNRKLFKHSSYSAKLETKLLEAFMSLTPNYRYFIEVDKTRKTGYAKLKVSPDQLIFVLDRDKIVELTKASKLVSNFANIKEETMYLFYSKELLMQLSEEDRDEIFELIDKNY